jgi:hypothetical protein
MCVDIEKLRRIVDPFVISPWSEIKETISLSEIQSELNNNFIINSEYNALKPETKAQHIQRIVKLLKDGWEDPIHLVFSKNFSWPIYDGNHRFMAAIYRKDEFILANCEGSMSIIKNIAY